VIEATIETDIDGSETVRVLKGWKGTIEEEQLDDPFERLHVLVAVRAEHVERRVARDGRQGGVGTILEQRLATEQLRGVGSKVEGRPTTCVRGVYDRLVLRENGPDLLVVSLERCHLQQCRLSGYDDGGRGWWTSKVDPIDTLFTPILCPFLIKPIFLLLLMLMLMLKMVMLSLLMLLL